ncbi:hypothetical protein BBD42_16035 [Paenibacillus sp. BIHB 4019]|uniref:Uncharacterized protein n=1 Tax=Paenibacillus sp. BIHB 4019 TaxID=1870819 RepID=A0A1B2DJD4_9BACL|nr:hypothetical protein [Paenibacillus sp. BIHB 4019]ANY67809.1 hypothetical protein BBD42_16035 [Paenibacillus sp. BIHB 4019]
MEQIYPLEEGVISRFCGMPVCIVTHDGARHFGVLSHCRGGKLTLNEQPGAQMLAEAESPKADKAKGKKKGKASKTAKEKVAQTQAYPYDPYYYNYNPGYNWPYGGAFAIDLALIAFLFLLI